MELENKIIVVTGGASGIGREMCRRFAREGAKKIVVADLDAAGAAAVAEEIDGIAMGVDVSDESQIVNLIETTENDVGPIDLFCSNAGIGIGRGIDTADEVWQTIWEVNTMAHVWAARALVPRMIARGWRLSVEHIVSSRTAQPNWLSNLCGNKTRRSCIG